MHLHSSLMATLSMKNFSETHNGFLYLILFNCCIAKMSINLIKYFAVCSKTTIKEKSSKDCNYIAIMLLPFHCEQLLYNACNRLNGAKECA